MMTLEEAFARLPHGDRICELYDECTCGRDEAIAVIREHLKAAVELLTIREEQIGEFLEVKTVEHIHHFVASTNIGVLAVCSVCGFQQLES